MRKARAGKPVRAFLSGAVIYALKFILITRLTPKSLKSFYITVWMNLMSLPQNDVP